MSFCGVCNRNHDPDLLCTEGAGQILRDMGLEKQNKPMPKDEFRRNELKAKKFVFLIFFIVLVLAIAFALFYKR